MFRTPCLVHSAEMKRHATERKSMEACVSPAALSEQPGGRVLERVTRAIGYSAFFGHSIFNIPSHFQFLIVLRVQITKSMTIISNTLGHVFI